MLAEFATPIKIKVVGNPWAKAIVLAICTLNPLYGWQSPEVRGLFAVEARKFFDKALDDRQESEGFTMILEPEMFWNIGDNSSFTLTPRLSVDQNDHQRSKFDLREAYLQQLYGNWEFRFGLAEVHWGQTEFVHLVNVINQTDLIEGIDEEEKLGQMMIETTTFIGDGTLQAWILPGFRERTFAGTAGRLRNIPHVDQDKTTYESGSGRYHTDFAARYSTFIQDWEVALSGFHGTHRIPRFKLNSDGSALAPHYLQTTQFTVESVAAIDAWLIKCEGLYRHLENEHHLAFTGGTEVTFVGINPSGHDLGWILEMAWHSEDDESAFASEIMSGFRWVFNDIDNTEFLAGLIYDWERGSQLCTLEASQRIGESLKLDIEGKFFHAIDSHDLLYSLRKDSHLMAELSYFF